MFDAVGKFLQDCKMYLQDPAYCDRDVQYRNPHVFLQDNQVVMTSSLQSGERHSESFETPSDIFDQFLTTDVLSEAQTPCDIRTPLHRSRELKSTLISGVLTSAQSSKTSTGLHAAERARMVL